MWANDKAITTAVFTIGRRLISKASRAPSGGMKWNSSDKWRLLILLLYLLLVMIEMRQSG